MQSCDFKNSNRIGSYILLRRGFKLVLRCFHTSNLESLTVTHHFLAFPNPYTLGPRLHLQKLRNLEPLDLSTKIKV